MTDKYRKYPKCCIVTEQKCMNAKQKNRNKYQKWQKIPKNVN